MTIKFLKDTKNIKEIGRLPKLMTFMANVSGLSIIALWVYEIIMNETHSHLLISLRLLGSFPIIVCVYYWIRFLRVNIQLKASKENTR